MMSGFEYSKNTKQIFYWLIFWCVLLFSAYLRVAISAPILLDEDSLGYLLPGLRCFSGEKFELLYARSFLYPGFLWLFIHFHQSLKYLATVQHFVSLLGIVILYRSTAIFSPFWALCAASILLLSPELIEYEHLVRPESIYLFITALSILLVATTIVKAINGDTRNMGALVTLSIVLGAATYCFRPNIGFGILVPIAFVIGAYRKTVRSFSKLSFWVGLGAVLSALLIIVPDRHFGRSDNARKTFLPLALLACHGNLLVPTIDSELPHSGHEDRERLLLLSDGLKEEITKFDAAPPTNTFKLLAIDPNPVMYSNEKISRYVQSFPTLEAFSSFSYGLMYRMIKRDPGAYGTKVVKQLSVVYGWESSPFLPERMPNISNLIERSLRLIEPIHLEDKRGEKLIRRYEKNLRANLGSTIDFPTIVSERVANILNKVFFVLLFLVPLLFIACCRKSGELRALGLFTLFLLTYNFFHSLSIALIGSLEVQRYVFAQFPAHLLFVAMGILFCLKCVYRLRRSN